MRLPRTAVRPEGVRRLESARGDQIDIAAGEDGARWLAFRTPRVACILCASSGCENDTDSIQPAIGLWALQGRLDLSVFAEEVVESAPELMTGLGRQYTVSARHPVESGAYLAGPRLRFVGRVDESEGSIPDVSLDYPGSLPRDRAAAEAVLCGALAAVEMGARPEAVERALRGPGAARLLHELAAPACSIAGHPAR